MAGALFKRFVLGQVLHDALDHRRLPARFRIGFIALDQITYLSVGTDDAIFETELNLAGTRVLVAQAKAFAVIGMHPFHQRLLRRDVDFRMEAENTEHLVRPL